MNVSQDLYDRTCAFVRTMANTCAVCLRPKSMCDNCDLYQARFLLSALSDAAAPVGKRRMRINTPTFRERRDLYRAIVAKFARPVPAREIDPSNSICGRGLKYWTLRRMVKEGSLVQSVAHGVVFFSLPSQQNKGKPK